MSKEDLNRAMNLGTLFLPGACLLILLAAAFVISVDMRRAAGSAPALDGEQITNIQFLSQPSSRSMTEAVEAACAATGCLGAEVATLIRVSVPEMTDEELQDMARTTERSVAELESLVGSASASAAEALKLQVLAEAEIAALYRAELRRRN